MHSSTSVVPYEQLIRIISIRPVLLNCNLQSHVNKNNNLLYWPHLDSTFTFGGLLDAVPEFEYIFHTQIIYYYLERMLWTLVANGIISAGGQQLGLIDAAYRIAAKLGRPTYEVKRAN